MPDILTRTDSCVRLLSSGKEISMPADCHVFDNSGFCVYCNAKAKQASEAIPEAKTGTQGDSGAGTSLPEPAATPETVTISLPELRSVILTVIDDGDNDGHSELTAIPWQLDHPFQDVANDARERMCDEIERRLRGLR